jgi:anti-sigma-K factor RskA
MTVITSQRRHQAVVLNQDLRPIAANRAYQLWLVDPDGNARSARVLISAHAAASAGARLVRGVRPGDQIAITREPAGGSQQPSMAPLAITRAA